MDYEKLFNLNSQILGQNSYLSAGFYPSEFEKLLPRFSKPKLVTNLETALRMAYDSRNQSYSGEDIKNHLNMITSKIDLAYLTGFTQLEELSNLIHSINAKLEKIDLKERYYFLYGIKIPIEIIDINQIGYKKVFIIEQDDETKFSSYSICS